MKNLLFVLGIVIMGLTSNLLHAQWVQMSNGMGTNKYVSCFASNASYIFAGLKSNNGVYRSNDNGNVWSQTALTTYDVTSLAISGSYLFVGTEVDGIYRSSDNGSSFTQVTTMAIIGDGVCLAISGSYIFAGTDFGVHLSTNNGNNWTQTSLINIEVESFAISGSYIFAGTQDSGVYLSTNNGTTWSKKSPNYYKVRSIAISGSYIFAGTQDSGVYLSTNNGDTWALTSMNNPTSALLISGNNIFAGNTPGGVFQSTNNGNSWTQRNEGLLTPMYNFALIIANNYIFTGMEGNSLWRRPLSEVVGIQNISTQIPESFSLYQNYPNPFNPTTTIEYQIPNQSLVTLKIFDVLGREVSTLVNEQKDAGSYKAQFNGSGLSSGAYIFRLTAGGSVQVQRMLLLK